MDSVTITRDDEYIKVRGIQPGDRVFVFVLDAEKGWFVIPPDCNRYSDDVDLENLQQYRVIGHEDGPTYYLYPAEEGFTFEQSIVVQVTRIVRDPKYPDIGTFDHGVIAQHMFKPPGTFSSNS